MSHHSTATAIFAVVLGLAHATLAAPGPAGCGTGSWIGGTTENTSDFTGACIAGDQLSYEIATDGPTQLAFSDGSTLDFPSAGVYTGTLPEPGSASSLAAGALLIVALARLRRS